MYFGNSDPNLQLPNPGSLDLEPNTQTQTRSSRLSGLIRMVPTKELLRYLKEQLQLEKESLVSSTRILEALAGFFAEYLSSSVVSGPRIADVSHLQG